MSRPNRTQRAAAALLIALALSPVAAFPQTKIKAGWNMFSTAQDVEIGQQSMKDALKQTPLLNDPEIDRYVDDIGQRLAAGAGGPKFDYQFHVVNSSQINAFALPGGFIFVNRGVLEIAKNDGEVAGVLAHEIAHVALRHGTHQATKAYAASAGLSILGSIVGGKAGHNAGDIINVVGGVGLNTLFLKYSRDLETQADVRGAQILAANGYSPDDMVNFFRALEKVDKSKKTSWLSDHPAPPDRIARIQQEEAVLQISPTPNRNTQQLAAIQSKLRPSGTFTSKSGAYQISYPNDWQVHEEGSNAVTIAAPNGIASVEPPQLVYGAIVNVSANGTSDVIDRLRLESSYLNRVDGPGDLDSGIAVAATLEGKNPLTGQNEHVTVVTRPLPDGNLVYLLFVTPASEVANARSVFSSMAKSMRLAPARQ